MVTLVNKTRKIKVYNLDTPFFRHKQWGATRVTSTTFEEHRDGRRLPREVHRSLPGSITLLAGESRKDLPDQIQAVPAIRKAISRGYLSVVKQKKEEAVAEKETAPAKAQKTKNRKTGEGQ